MFMNYFHGEEADQFAFFRIPKVLMKASRYAGLRLEAKLLYGLMLDRMELSRKNGWIDEEGRVFIIYKNESVMQDLPCSRQNAVLFLKQLEDAGLIKRVRRGQGLPSIIYVLKFASESNDTDHPEGGSENSSERTEKPEVKNNALLSKTGSEGVSEGAEQQEIKNNTLTLQTNSESVSEGAEQQEIKNNTLTLQTGAENVPESIDVQVQQEAKCAYQAVKKDTRSAKSKTFRRRISRSSKSEFLEVPNPNLMNHTDYNYTDSESIYPSNIVYIYNRRTDRTDMPKKKEHESVMATPATQHEVPVSPESIRAQIDYDALALDMSDSRQLDDVVSIIGDVLNARQTTTYKIHGNTMSADDVKGRFKGLTSKHIKYVLDSINSITYGIRNIRAYMISALYTATQTLNLFDANKGNIGKESPYKGNVGTVRVNKFNNFPQREIDFDAMEQLVFGY